LDPLAKSVEALTDLLGKPEGEPRPLEGGITNRNYRARFGGSEVVIRLPGKDTALLEIDREAERAANENAARVGVAPAVAALLSDPAALVTYFVEGREMTAAELREPTALAEVARALRAVHESGARLPIAFSGFRIVESYAERAARRGVEVPDSYAWALAEATRIENALGEGDPVPCHNDLLAANFLRGADGLRIVDWEYAGMGNRYFDLGNFAVNNELGPEQEAALAGEYFGRPAAARELASLRLMRFMSDFREAMWAVLQGSLSDLDFDFAAYADEHFERLRATAADPSFAGWLEQARG
jgi:thiamine kinase-like enzyme